MSCFFIFEFRNLKENTMLKAITKAKYNALKSGARKIEVVNFYHCLEVMGSDENGTVFSETICKWNVPGIVWGKENPDGTISY